jgi:hypothetical protein
MPNKMKLRSGSISLGALCGVLGSLALLTWVVVQPAPVDVVPTEGTRADEVWPEPDVEPICEAKPDAESQAGGCKPCKGRSWCTCTTTVGDRTAARISCEPCCYYAPWASTPYCLD